MHDGDPTSTRRRAKKLQMEICQKNLTKLESSQWGFSDSITGDETWVYHHAID